MISLKASRFDFSTTNPFGIGNGSNELTFTLSELAHAAITVGHERGWRQTVAYALSARRPVVRILEPNLRVISEGKRVSHLFDQEKQTLCLHYHGVWKPNTLLAETIIPWAVMWTEYFEWWLATGKWHGDEVIHQGAKR